LGGLGKNVDKTIKKEGNDDAPRREKTIKKAVNVSPGKRVWVD